MINETLLKELQEFADTDKIKEICKEIDNSDDRHLISQQIEYLQQMNNDIYERTGYNTVTLDFQVFINELRQKYDVTDPREVEHVDGGEEYVQ